MQEIINYEKCVFETLKKRDILGYKYLKKAKKLITKGIKQAMRKGEFEVRVNVEHCFPGRDWIKEARPHLQAWIEAQGYYVRKYSVFSSCLEVCAEAYSILWGDAATQAQAEEEKKDQLMKDLKHENN